MVRFSNWESQFQTLGALAAWTAMKTLPHMFSRRTSPRPLFTQDCKSRSFFRGKVFVLQIWRLSAAVQALQDSHVSKCFLSYSSPVWSCRKYFQSNPIIAKLAVKKCFSRLWSPESAVRQRSQLEKVSEYWIPVYEIWMARSALVILWESFSPISLMAFDHAAY